MPTSTEQEVVRKAIAGDRLAFRELVERHQGFALSLSSRFVERDEAEDITQEAFVRLWKHLPKYRFDVKLTTWLYTIVSNLCLDHLRSRRGRFQKQRRSMDDHPGLPDSRTSDAHVLEEEFRTNVLKMTESLTPRQKAVFVLRDLEELSMKEVSEILAMSANNVKSNLYYARLKMGEMLKEYDRVPKTEFL